MNNGAESLNAPLWRPARQGRRCVVDVQSVVFGEGVTLENYVEIQQHVVVHAGAVIRSYTRVGHHCTIGARCVIKCAAIMGPYTVLKADVFVGPQTVFLSDLGSNLTNTLVGSGAFIGAGCMVMPGVTIGANAFVAAGTRVNRDCESGKAYGGVPMRELSKSGPEMKRRVFGG